MISLRQVIKQIRLRLRDTNKPYKIDDLEVIHSINQTYNDLNFQFKLHENKFTKHLSPEDNVIILPKMALSFEKAFLDAKKLDLKKFDEFSDEVILCAYSNMQSFAVLPKHRANGELTLYVNLAQSIDESTEFLNVDYLNEALIYGSLSFLFQIENNENNLERASFYKDLYKKETDRLRALFSSVFESKSFQSQCIQI